MLVRMWEKGTLTSCWWECKLVQLPSKAVWRFLKKLEVDLPYNSVTPLLGIYLKECEPRYQSHLHAHVYHSTIHDR
jgi:hypothetical protein